MELGCESWTSFASGCSSTTVQRTLFCDSAQARQLKQQLRSALVAGQWRGDTVLTLLAAVHNLSGLFSDGILGRAFTLSLSSPPPPPPSPVPNKQSRFCGRKAIIMVNPLFKAIIYSVSEVSKLVTI